MRVHHVCVQHEDLYLSERHWESLVVIYTATRHNLLLGLALFLPRKSSRTKFAFGELQAKRNSEKQISWSTSIEALKNRDTPRAAWSTDLQGSNLCVCGNSGLAETLWHSGKVCTKSQSLHKVCTSSAQSLHKVCKPRKPRITASFNFLPGITHRSLAQV